MNTAIELSSAHRLVASSVALSFFIVACLLADSARAACDADTMASADALFDSGRALMEQKRYAEACEKLAASQKLCPGSGTLLNLADCYELTGRTASAWSTFRQAASAASAKGRVEREAEARRRAVALEARLSKLTIVVDTAAQPQTLTVKRNGAPLSAAAWNTALAVDPGAVVVEASAPGYETWSSKLLLRPGPSAQRLDVPSLKFVGSKTTETPPPSSWGAQRIAAMVIGGVGIVAAGVGLGLGVYAMRKDDDSRGAGLCDQEDYCSDVGLDLRESALSSAHASTGLVVGGLALLGGATVLYLTAPTSSRGGGSPSNGRIGLGVMAAPHQAGLMLRGSW